MSLLTSPLPEAVEVNGISYPIRTDFKIWLEFGDLAADIQKNYVNMLTACYTDRLPPSLNEALLALVRFYVGGFETHADGGASRRPIVSFSADAEYIYSAYLSQYQIDLTAASMHWYQFMALFRSLDDSCRLSKIMEARAVNLGSIKDKNLKSYYRKMKRAYRLPDNRTEEQKERDMIRALESAF